MRIKKINTFHISEKNFKSVKIFLQIKHLNYSAMESFLILFTTYSIFFWTLFIPFSLIT